jgi:hypothetical protein
MEQTVEYVNQSVGRRGWEMNNNNSNNNNQQTNQPTNQLRYRLPPN